MGTKMRLLLAAFLVARIAAADTNLLQNGDFGNAAAASGWTCSSIFGSSSWTADDAESSPVSGSIALSASAFGGDPYWLQGLEICDSACFDVKPGAAYAFGGQSRLVAAAGAAGSSFALHFSCGVYTQRACGGTPAWLPQPTLSAWPDWSAPPAAADGTLPLDGISAACQLLVVADGDSASGTAHFDNLFFTTDVIFAAGFD